MQNDIFAAIELIIDRRVPVELGTGVIQTINGPSATVFMNGAAGGVVATIASNVNARAGDNCIMVRPRKTQSWIIMAAHNWSMTHSGDQADYKSSGLVPAPENIRTNSSVAGNIVVEWDADRDNIVVYEVQTNTAADEVGADSLLTTRGSFAIINTSSSLYVRVRAISTDGRFSEWTNWVLGTPGSVQQGIYVAEFSYLTSTAETIASVSQGTIALRIDLWIDTPFNGGASISIGELGAVERLMGTAENDPAEAGLYSKTLYYEYPGDQQVKFYITKSPQTTQGAGRVVITTK